MEDNGRLPFYIKDTKQTLALLSNLKVPALAALCSPDVEALYSSIPHTRGIQHIGSYLEKREDQYIPHNNFALELLKSSLTHNYLIFKNKFYHQVNNGSLRIVSVERVNAGIYTCHAASEEGEVMHTSRVLVQGPPTIVIPPENTTVNVSQDAFLTCQAEAYPANLTYSWFQGNSNVYLLSRLQSRVRILVDGSLLLQQVTPEDAGKYTCIPSNGMWKSPSASAYLTVLRMYQCGLPSSHVDFYPVL
ncbi:turtle homolog A-like [Pelobates cultripes]|uniref:Turtle homolog A-like n=1 Tax=Pelobates cultripes TaxID=61616 RepID=A0AAD1RNN7_PELCU|nr:turtle homolog A-like [Pelobates cultripes]